MKFGGDLNTLIIVLFSLFEHFAAGSTYCSSSVLGNIEYVILFVNIMRDVM